MGRKGKGKLGVTTHWKGKEGEGRETGSAVCTHPHSGTVVPECSEVYTCPRNTSVSDSP